MCKNLDITSQTLNEQIVTTVGITETVILSQARRICVQVEKTPQLSEILRFTQDDIASRDLFVR